MEAISIIIGIIGLIIAYATYNRQFNQPPPVFEEPEPVAEKENLKIVFKATQKLSLEVQDLIQNHIDRGNGDRLMFWNVTFQQYLDLQKSEFNKCLSDELYFKIDDLPRNKPIIEEMTKSVITQMNELQLLKNNMNLLNNGSSSSLEPENKVELFNLSFSIFDNQRDLKPSIQSLVEKYNGDLDVFEIIKEDLYFAFFKNNNDLINFKIELHQILPNIKINSNNKP